MLGLGLGSLNVKRWLAVGGARAFTTCVGIIHPWDELGMLLCCCCFLGQPESEFGLHGTQLGGPPDTFFVVVDRNAG